MVHPLWWPGVDPTLQQWRGILAVVQERHLLPFFDSAYQVRDLALFLSDCLRCCSPTLSPKLLSCAHTNRLLLSDAKGVVQGFASGDLEGDAAAVRLFADAGLEMLLAQVSRSFWLCKKSRVSHCTAWMLPETITHLALLTFLIFQHRILPSGPGNGTACWRVMSIGWR